MNSKSPNLFPTTLIIMIAFYLILTLSVRFNFMAQDWNQITANQYASCSLTYPLGTNFNGQNILSRVLQSLTNSLDHALAVTFFCCLIASLLAFLVGLRKKKRLYQLTIFLSNTLDTIPIYLLIFCYYQAIRLDPHKLYYIIIAVFWTHPFKSLVNQVLTVASHNDILAAKHIGCSNFRILYKYILPKMYLPLLAEANLVFISTLKLETSLSFIGIYNDKTINLGKMLAEAVGDLLYEKYNNLIASSFALTLLIYSLTLLKNIFETIRKKKA